MLIYNTYGLFSNLCPDFLVIMPFFGAQISKQIYCKMIVILSPSKTMVSNANCNTTHYTEPVFLSESQKLVDQLQKLSCDEIGRLMKINSRLARINQQRFQLWHSGSLPKIQACCAYKGEVYNGLEAYNMDEPTLLYMQNHLYILSGLYGMLKPLDKVMPYRLEMDTRLKSGSLYEFWGNKMSELLSKLLQETNSSLVNLASMEYFKSIKPKMLNQRIITPEFKEYKSGKHVVVTVYAKKARGMMTRFIMENQLDNPDDLKAFDYDGYYYNPHLSSENSPVFTR